MTVFICYSTASSAEAGTVRDWVSAVSGSDPWIAPWSIRPGENWQSQIVNAIQDCASFVVVVTEAACRSEEVQREVSLARSRAKHIIPIVFDGELPTGSLEYALSTLHFVPAQRASTDIPSALRAAFGAPSPASPSTQGDRYVDREGAERPWSPPPLPSTSEYYSRPTLVSGLREGLRTSDLIVVSGVPGSGKSFVVSEALHETTRPVLWIRSDVDCVSVVPELAQFLNSVHRPESLQALRSGAPTSTVAKSIARAIQTTDAIVVLENPNKIDSDELSVLLDPFLAKDLQATLVLVGSVLPPQIHVRDLARPSILSMSVGALSFEESADFLDARCDGLNDRSKELIHACTNGLIVLIDIVASQVRAYGLSNEEVEASLADLEFEFDDYLATHVLSNLEDSERRVVDFLSASLIPLGGADLVGMIGAGTEQVVRASLASLESKSVIERRRLDYTVHSAIRDRVYRLAADKKKLHETTAAILDLKARTTLVLRERHRHLVLAGHHDEAVDLLIENFGTFWREGNRQWVLSLFEQMELKPQSHLKREAAIALLMCQVLHENGELERVRTIYEGLLAEDLNPPAQAWTLNNAAELPARRGDVDGAIELYELAIQATTSDMEISYIRHNAAVLCARMNRLGEANERSAELIGEMTGDWSSKRTSRLGLLAFSDGDLEASRAAAREDLLESERSSSSDGVARAKNNLAVIALATGEWDDAGLLLNESLEINEAQADRHAVAQGWANLGVLRALQGSTDEFEELTQHALAEFLRFDDWVAGRDCAFNLVAFGYTPRHDVPLSCEGLVAHHGLNGLRCLLNVSYGYLPL